MALEILDRVPTKPGRVLITPEDGSAPFYAVMSRADEPKQEGTPINKELLDNMTKAINVGVSTEVQELLGADNVDDGLKNLGSAATVKLELVSSGVVSPITTEPNITFTSIVIPISNLKDISSLRIKLSGYASCTGTWSTNQNTLACSINFISNIVTFQARRDIPSEGRFDICVDFPVANINLYAKTITISGVAYDIGTGEITIPLKLSSDYSKYLTLNISEMNYEIYTVY